MEGLCSKLWGKLQGPIVPLAILYRKDPLQLLVRILDWCSTRSDEYIVRRKFGSSFGSIRTDKETSLTFAEMKRTAVQVITLNTLQRCLSVFEKLGGAEERRIMIRIASHALDVISEVHSSNLRRPAYQVPLQLLFRAIGQSCFEVLVEFLNLTIRDVAKSSKLDLYISSFAQVQLCLYPNEELEQTLFFVETLASYYVDAKGFENRLSFSKTLKNLFLPLIEPISAEVNLPKWDKVFSKILLRRVFSLCEKQKYRLVTLELAVLVLCLSSREIFYEKWFGLVEAIALMIKVTCDLYGY